MTHESRKQAGNLAKSATVTDGSILNRKKESRALPSSFSSNLGRRHSPHEHRREAPSSTPGASVKAIVAWLESSSELRAASKIATSCDVDSKLSSATPSISSQATNPTIQTLHRAPDVEEYSLTLLRYQKYFNERPLGRCLDSDEPSKETREQSRTRNNKETKPATLGLTTTEFGRELTGYETTLRKSEEISPADPCSVMPTSNLNCKPTTTVPTTTSPSQDILSLSN